MSHRRREHAPSITVPRREPGDEVHRFEPDRARAREENRIAAVLAMAAAALFLYFGRGERDLSVLCLFAALAGGATYLFYEWRARRGLATVEIDDRGIVVIRPRSTWRLEWSEIRRVDHHYYGGERWTFQPESGWPRVLGVAGLTPGAARTLGELIRERAAPPSDQTRQG